MLQINLLPGPEKDKILSQRVSSYLANLMTPIIILIILIIGALFLLTQYLSTIDKNLQEQIATKNSAKTKFNQTQEQINEFNKISDIIGQLSAYKVDWVAIFSNLALQTPNKLQISQLQLDDKDPRKAKISGFADSNRTVMLFMEKLDESEQFKNSLLVSSDFTESNIVNFSLSFEFEKANIPKESKEAQGAQKE